MDKILDRLSNEEACQVSSTLISKNITIIGRRTSIRLEPEMWKALTDIAKREKCSIHDICSLVYIRKSSETSFTAAIRVFLMLYYKSACTEQGHARAGHGSFSAMLKRARIQDELFFFSGSNKNNLMKTEDREEKKVRNA